MSKTPPSSCELIERLSARHDELIERLDELNAQIERALAQVFRPRSEASRSGLAECPDSPDSRRAA
jgi:hypothetical protein